MRLAELIPELDDDQLERLEATHVGEGEQVSRDVLCQKLESALRSFSFVRRFVSDCLPPTFSILEVLLEADGYAVNASSFREAVDARTSSLAERVKTGDLIGRDDALRLYRRVLHEARRNDLVLDASETAILGVLRQELGIRPVEHFLVEYHEDFHHFWLKAHAFLDQMSSLRSGGLVFSRDGKLLLPEDVVPLVRKVLGFEMAPANRRRLFEKLNGAELSAILDGCALRLSGSREEKLSRLLNSYVQPSEALRCLSGQALKDLCKGSNAAVSGVKDELVERLVDHFQQGLDVDTGAPPVPEVPPETRVLDEAHFRGLFNSLRHDDLTDILVGLDSSRITGSKETKVGLLVASSFNEVTLLDKLTNRALEEVLSRSGERTSGSKRERIQRIIESSRSLVSVDSQPDPPTPG